MSTPRLYHIGIVVKDLDAAAAEFTQLFGMKWAEPFHHDLPVKTPQGIVRSRFRFTYSRGAPGATRLELIEGPEGTPWWPGEGVTAALHHIGFWSDDLAGDAERLAGAGAAIEACLVHSDGTPKLFTYQQLAHGPLVELVDVARRPSMMRWIDGDADDTDTSTS